MTSPAQLKQFTGARTRLVWTQQQDGCTDFIGNESDFKLLGFDTEEGERILQNEVSAYACPMMTPNGDRVIFTNNEDQCVYVINWDGSGKRKIADGSYGIAVWKDPETAIEWVYMRPHKTRSWFSKSKPIRRLQIDHPDIAEEVWNKKSVSWGWLQLSADGTHAATVMFWPSSGMVTIPFGEFTKFDKGCWTAMAPDNSYRMWVFDGDHRTVKMYNVRGERLCRVDIHQAPGVNGWEIYHPRWSNHLRYMTVTGPYSGNRHHECKPGE